MCLCKNSEPQRTNMLLQPSTTSQRSFPRLSSTPSCAWGSACLLCRNLSNLGSHHFLQNNFQEPCFLGARAAQSRACSLLWCLSYRCCLLDDHSACHETKGPIWIKKKENYHRHGSSWSEDKQKEELLLLLLENKFPERKSCLLHRVPQWKAHAARMKMISNGR